MIAKPIMRYLIVLLLAGCTQYVWVKPDATHQDFNRDSGQCKAQAFGAPPAQAAIVYSNCMYGKDWYEVEKE